VTAIQEKINAFAVNLEQIFTINSDVVHTFTISIPVTGSTVLRATRLSKTYLIVSPRHTTCFYTYFSAQAFKIVDENCCASIL
jgi:hypothetical protein